MEGTTEPGVGATPIRQEGVAPAGPERHYFMRVTPGSVQVGVSRYDPEVGRERSQVGGGERGSRSGIQGFSADSRQRCLRRSVSLPWDEAPGLGGLGMVTLTYPERFPKDGTLVKAHLDRLYRRWCRRYEKPRGMWKLEFQQRGAPHFHCFVGLPEPEDELKATLLRVWYEVVGSGDERHLFHGVDISRWRWGTLGENRSKIGEYFTRHGAKGWKSYQNELPDGYTSPGRWWGVWGLKPVEHVVELERAEYMQHRRLTWTLQEKNRGRKARKGGRHKGAFTLSVDGIGTGIRWVEGLRSAPAL